MQEVTLAVAAMLLAAAPAAAAPMDVATFLGKTEALKAKGMMALFSPDLKLLTAQGQAAGKAWRVQAKRPGVCAPEKTSMKTDEFLAMLQAVPVAERPRTSVTAAVTRGLNRRFACKG